MEREFCDDGRSSASQPLPPARSGMLSLGPGCSPWLWDAALGPGCSPWLWDAPLGSRMPSSTLEFQVGAKGLPDPGAGHPFL